MAKFNPRAVLYEDNIRKIEVVYSFMNFIIPLPVNCVRHSSDVTPKDWQSICLSKLLQRIVRLLQQKHCQAPAELNDTFKFLPWQLDYQ